MSRQRSVKRIFSFSSGTLNKLGIWGAVIGSARDRSARLLDLGARGGGHRHALHAELAPHLTHAERLDLVRRPDPPIKLLRMGDGRRKFRVKGLTVAAAARPKIERAGRATPRSAAHRPPA